MRAGGATSLAEIGVPPQLIQAIGGWASIAFQIYIRTHRMQKPSADAPSVGPSGGGESGGGGVAMGLAVMRGQGGMASIPAR